ncbi:hypothetical protein [Kitasatospora sp. MAP5-34]|uniref:hypothetical protein n=1 Tax=Kitasatospora sp. MAP5-34 TaxID=3035102 RepID=UPI002473ADA4|nr:hypothetical protein [Kitasatospora sp. MAP5-34]MDH6578743.1 hypothetical protein [Kitasatospora sp. MAP5-34]
MGPLTNTAARRPSARVQAALDGAGCGLLVGLTGTVAVLLLWNGRRRTHLRRAREVLSDRRGYPPTPPWP